MFTNNCISFEITWEQVGDDAVKQRQIMRQELGYVDVAQSTQQEHVLRLVRELSLQVACRAGNK